MKIRKSNIAKATIIPSLCVFASILPQKANANWAAGIGYLFSGLITGCGTAVVSSSCRPKTVVVNQPVQYVQEQPVATYIPQNQQTYTTTQQQAYVPVQQTASEQAPVFYTEKQNIQPVKKIIRRRIIRRTITTQQGVSQPVVEEIIEEIPVTNQQVTPQYNAGHGY